LELLELAEIYNKNKKISAAQFNRRYSKTYYKNAKKGKKKYA
jgi:hypothetical protein